MRFRTRNDGQMLVTPVTMEHLQAHPEVWKLLPEAMCNLYLPTDGSPIDLAMDMGRVIGRSGCVATPRIEPNESTIFARRVARANASRVVVGVQGPEVRTLVIRATRNERGMYELHTAYVGVLAPPEPWSIRVESESDMARAAESLSFWCTHGLVYNPDVMGAPFESTWELVLSRPIEVINP